MGRRMAGLRLTKGEPGVAFSGAAPAQLRSTAALAFPIQAAGAELLKESPALLMPRLWSELPGVRLCHVIHDEILLEAPEALAQAAAELLLEVMQDPGCQDTYLRGVLPLVAEVSVGRTRGRDPLTLEFASLPREEFNETEQRIGRKNENT